MRGTYPTWFQQTKNVQCKNMKLRWQFVDDDDDDNDNITNNNNDNSNQLINQCHAPDPTT